MPCWSWYLTSSPTSSTASSIPGLPTARGEGYGPSAQVAVVDDTPTAPTRALDAYPPRTLWSDVWRRYCRHRLAMVGTVVMLILSLAPPSGPMVYPVPIDDIDFAVKLTGPSLAHPFGTDDLGQDLLARILYGGRISMAVGLAAMLIAILLGMVIGALAGFFGACSTAF